MAVRLTPGAGPDRIDGVHDGVLRARVAARPVDGAANDALVRLIAGSLGVAAGRVSLRSGARSRAKVVEIEGMDAEGVKSVWPGVDV